MTKIHRLKCISQSAGLGGVPLLFVGFHLWFVCPSYPFVVLLQPDAHSDRARHHRVFATAKTVSLKLVLLIFSDETSSGCFLPKKKIL